MFAAPARSHGSAQAQDFAKLDDVVHVHNFARVRCARSTTQRSRLFSAAETRLHCGLIVLKETGPGPAIQARFEVLAGGTPQVPRPI